jgi:hypothetical protein
MGVATVILCCSKSRTFPAQCGLLWTYKWQIIKDIDDVAQRGFELSIELLPYAWDDQLRMPSRCHRILSGHSDVLFALRCGLTKAAVEAACP